MLLLMSSYNCIYNNDIIKELKVDNFFYIIVMN